MIEYRLPVDLSTTGPVAVVGLTLVLDTSVFPHV